MGDHHVTIQVNTDESVECVQDNVRVNQGEEQQCDEKEFLIFERKPTSHLFIIFVVAVLFFTLGRIITQ